MAGYRQFHTKFWKDEWLIELEPLERYLFSYLFTNELSSISGIYKLPKRVIRNETGLAEKFIDETLKKFQDARKIFYKDGVVWVVNMKQYHKNASPKTMIRVNADVAQIEDCDVKTSYLYYEKTGEYCIDTVSIPGRVSLILSTILSKNKSENKSDDLPLRPNIYSVYEHEIGALTATIAEELELAEKDYPAGWVEDALKESARMNKRSWKYAEAILKRWNVEGRGDKPKSNGNKPSVPVMITLPSGEVVEARS
jgi:DnaD/phage-associated family protein